VLIFRDPLAWNKAEQKTDVEIINKADSKSYARPQLINDWDDQYIFSSQHSRKPHVVCSAFLVNLTYESISDYPKNDSEFKFLADLLKSLVLVHRP